MDIQCEKCRTVFNINETLMKEGGSKVRCSVCRHVFTAYPPVHASDAMEAEDPVEPGRAPQEAAEATPEAEAPVEVGLQAVP